MLRVVALAVAVAVVAPSVAAAEPYVVVYMDRNGQVDNMGFRVTSPRYGGSELAWASIVACVKRRFAPFDIAIVTRKPRGQYIRVLVGGLASQFGYDDDKVNGLAPSSRVQLDATVHVFSQVGSGEEDVDNLCEVAAHEIGHALGLDHEYLADDVMSYLSRLRVWNTRSTTFLDVDARCGEYAERDCESGARTQNSYRHLAAVVGLKHPLAPEDPYSDRRRPMDPYAPPPRIVDDREPIDPYDAPRWRPSRPIDVQRLTLKKLPDDCTGNALEIAACHAIR